MEGIGGIHGRFRAAYYEDEDGFQSFIKKKNVNY